MSVRVRFAPSPTGSLHVGNALDAVANRAYADSHGGQLVLRLDDTDATRVVPGGEGEVLADLAWLGVAWDEGPIRQSDRAAIYAAAAARLLESGAATREPDGTVRLVAPPRPTLLRADRTATYQLAFVEHREHKFYNLFDKFHFGIGNVAKTFESGTLYHRCVYKAMTTLV